MAQIRSRATEHRRKKAKLVEIDTEFLDAIASLECRYESKSMSLHKPNNLYIDNIECKLNVY